MDLREEELNSSIENDHFSLKIYKTYLNLNGEKSKYLNE